jgi:hypothetical protein
MKRQVAVRTASALVVQSVYLQFPQRFIKPKNETPAANPGVGILV